MMSETCALFGRFRHDDRGLETVEFAIVLGVVILGVIGAVAAVGLWLTGAWTVVRSSVGVNDVR